MNVVSARVEVYVAYFILKKLMLQPLGDTNETEKRVRGETRKSD